MQLRYFVPFKASDDVKADSALREKLVNIEGVAIDTSVNSNKWQIPDSDLDFVAAGLQGAQLRVDHAESALMVVGKVIQANRDGSRVMFRAEVGEEKLIEKILRSYVTHVSIQVDSNDVECSKCGKPTRKEGMLVHLCPEAWEIIHEPKVRELSIVASPAYKDTAFVPVGFAAAMDLNQNAAKSASLKATAEVLRQLKRLRILASQIFSQSFVIGKTGDDEGSRRESQEPDKKTLSAKEVKHMSENNAQQGASSHSASDGVVNTANPDGKGEPVTYEDFMDQLTKLEQHVTATPGLSDAEAEALKKKVADLEAEVAKRATKKALSKKISDLTKQLQQQDGAEAESSEAEGAEAEGAEAEAAEAEAAGAARRRAGRGIVALDQLQSQGDPFDKYPWFKDLLKAHKKLVGFQ
jgi:hypothetical protein